MYVVVDDETEQWLTEPIWQVDALSIARNVAGTHVEEVEN